jgi:hypothetical protein
MACDWGSWRWHATCTLEKVADADIHMARVWVVDEMWDTVVWFEGRFTKLHRMILSSPVGTVPSWKEDVVCAGETATNWCVTQTSAIAAMRYTRQVVGGYCGMSSPFRTASAGLRNSSPRCREVLRQLYCCGDVLEGCTSRAKDRDQIEQR